MTGPEGTEQDTELDSTTSIIEGSANTLERPREGGTTGDYQARLREFDNTEPARSRRCSRNPATWMRAIWRCNS